MFNKPGERGRPIPAMIPLLRSIVDLIVAFTAPRAVLLAENLLLRQQVIVLRRRAARPRLRPPRPWAHRRARRRVPPSAGRDHRRQARHRHPLAPDWLATILAAAITRSTLGAPTARRRSARADPAHVA